MRTAGLLLLLAACGEDWATWAPKHDCRKIEEIPEHSERQFRQTGKNYFYYVNVVVPLKSRCLCDDDRVYYIEGTSCL